MQSNFFTVAHNPETAMQQHKFRVQIFPVVGNGNLPEYDILAETIEDVTTYLKHQVPAYDYPGGEVDAEVDGVWRVVVDDLSHPVPKKRSLKPAATD